MSLDNGSSAVGMPELVVICAPSFLKPFCRKNLTTSLRLTILSPIPFIVNIIVNLASSHVSKASLATGGPSWVRSRPSLRVRFAAAPNHGRSLSRRWRRRCNFPCFHDNDLVLRFDGVRPARSTFESSATATRFQRGFHVSCNRFQRGLPVRCRIFQRVSKVRAAPALRGCRPLS